MFFDFGSGIRAVLAWTCRGMITGMASAMACMVDAFRSSNRIANRSIDRLSGGVFDLRLPCSADLRGDGVRQRHVVERIGNLVAVVRIQTVAELQHYARRFRLGLRLVHQDERRTGDRPRVLSGL